MIRRVHPGDHIRRGGAEDLDRLEPLWVSVHHRHVESMPELAPYVDDATTWAVRRALYAELLAKPDTVLLLAFAGETLVGYGMAHVMSAAKSWAADTWVTGPRIGEIESMAVLPEHRGRRLGTPGCTCRASGSARPAARRGSPRPRSRTARGCPPRPRRDRG